MKILGILLLVLIGLPSKSQNSLTLNVKDDGFRGIWYFIGNTNNEYAYKYSGGLGTYPANHYPFSVYSKEVNKTFFCYGGASKDSISSLLHEVAYFDHTTKKISQPTIIIDKKTNDAHDNPVISIDREGYIWIFSTSHGVERPSYIHKSSKPFNIDKFNKVDAIYKVNGKDVPFTNFSYLQIYYDQKKGFFGLMTHYEKGVIKYGKNKPRRTIGFITSSDGVNWSNIQDIGQIQEGHYQSSGVTKLKDGSLKIASAFNYHPDTQNGAGLDYRTNLYYVETSDFGKTWQNAKGDQLTFPLVEVKNNALVIDSGSESKLLYINDLAFDNAANPMISYITSAGPNPGLSNGPYVFSTAYYNGEIWKIEKVSTVDHNYDYGSLYFDNNKWKIIAPFGKKPFEYNTGGELEMWEKHNSNDKWKFIKNLTINSKNNHSYPRKAVNWHPEFNAFWADGNPRKPSISHFYFSDSEGHVFQLPYKFKGNFYKIIQP